MERRRDRERRNGADELVAVLVFPDQPGFEHRLRQLLDEQRHAVRLGDDVLQDLLGQGPSVGHPPRDLGRLGRTQPVQGARVTWGRLGHFGA